MSKRARSILLVLGLILGIALWFTPPPEIDLPAPPVPRLTQPEQQEVRPVSSIALLDWGRHPTPVLMIDVPKDALPNGLALSMLPFLVDWSQTEIAGPDPQVRVRNVSVGGNPTVGENLLATIDVPIAGIADVQWCLTPDRNKKGKDTAMGHAQLRFVFRPDNRPVVLGEDGAPLTRGRRPVVREGRPTPLLLVFLHRRDTLRQTAGQHDVRPGAPGRDRLSGPGGHCHTHSGAAGRGLTAFPHPTGRVDPADDAIGPPSANGVCARRRSSSDSDNRPDRAYADDRDARRRDRLAPPIICANGGYSSRLYLTTPRFLRTNSFPMMMSNHCGQ